MSGIRNLTAIFQAVALACPQGVKAIAAELDKAPSTLYEELLPTVNRPNQGKLGVEDGLSIMAITGDVRPLEYMASSLGYRLVSLADVCPDKPTLPEELLDDIPALAAYHDAIRQGLPVEAVNAVLQLVIKDLEQDFVAYRAKCEAVGQKRRKVA